VTVVNQGPALAAVLDDLDQRRAEWDVTALEVAVVAPGLPDLATALGRRAADGDDEVGTGTLFHHGSCVKAYTALAAALLAEDGVLDLDAPVRRLVPELRVPDPVLAERITLRDLLSHRSGLGRHDLAWILRPELDEAGLLGAVAALPPDQAVVGNELAVSYMEELYPVTVRSNDATPLFDPTNDRIKGLS